MANWKMRAASVILTASMVAGPVPAVFAASATTAGSDIDGHWAQNVMEQFISDGLLNGDGDGNYRPNSPISRAEYAALLNRIMNLTQESSSVSNYTDVALTSWYYSDMAKALARGYMNGTSATTMAPTQNVTREQAFVMVARILGLDTENADLSSLDAFSDKDSISEYAKPALAAMVSSDYVKGSDGKLFPKDPLTRAEGVTVLNSTKDKLEAAGGDTPVTPGSYKDGVYTGTGAGYGGTMTCQVTIEGGKITDIQILSHRETDSYLTRAKTMIDKIINNQSTDGVDTVSGATKSSNGILTAVGACLSQAQGGADTSTTGSTGGGGGGSGKGSKDTGIDVEYGGLTDGVYSGSSTGYGGALTVEVTVAGGKITGIQVTSHRETSSYYNKGVKVIDTIVSNQTTDVDTVSGATYTSAGIIKAVKDALGQASENTTYKVTSWSEFTAAAAQASDTDVIRLQNDLTNAGDKVDATSSATLGMVTINKSITVDGAGHSISAGSDTGFCFDVTTASDIVMKDLTIDGAFYKNKLGGAMYVETGANLLLENVTFKNCYAGSAGSGNGGAAFYAEPHRGSSPTVTATNCTFEDNLVNDGTTGRGGAVYGYNANIVLENCTFSGNKAGYGGAVAAAGSSNLTVKNCSFTASNDGAYGGDDIYVFDGYSDYKKGMVADSAVAFAISGNTYEGKESETDGDFTTYRVVRGSVLGDVTTTSTSTDEEGKETEVTTTASYDGAGESIFLSGYQLTFDIDDVENGRTRKALKAGSSPVDGAEEYRIVFMNIPYDKFYAADLENNDEPVDAFTSATLNKSKTSTLAGGSYHTDPEGTDIAGITFPVAVSRDIDLSSYHYKKVTDTDSVTIEVTNRGQTSTATYTGKDALFENESYAYYEAGDSENPSCYKVLTADENGELSFGAVQGAKKQVSGVSATFMTASSYGDYQLNLVGLDEIGGNDPIYGVVIKTEDGTGYGLRHMENIWRGTELAWCTGFTPSVHGCPTSSAHYASMMGKTITSVVYYTMDGLVEIPLNIYVPIKFECKAFSVADADVVAGQTAVNTSEFPEAYQPAYTVTDSDGEIVQGIECDGKKLTWESAKQGAYTLTAEDENGVYASYSTSFTLTTDKTVAAYDSDSMALVPAENASDEDFRDFLSHIESVSVNEKSYPATGRNAVTIVNENGYIDLSSEPFGEMAAGSEYRVEMTAAGYSTPVTFTVVIPDMIYAYASLSYAEYWAAEDIDVVGDDLSAPAEGTDNNDESDLGAFDAVSRATSTHGWHRGSFQQDTVIRTTDGQSLKIAYWKDGSTVVLFDGTEAAWDRENRTLSYRSGRNEVTLTVDNYGILGIKYVPVAIAAENYHAFCETYDVTQNGEMMSGGYSENNLTAYTDLAACVTADTNGLKAVSCTDGIWSFGARQTGSGSGILGKSQKQASSGITVNVVSESKFGDFIRVDLKGDYGDMGSNMQTVEWKYYGTASPDSPDAEPLAVYGTKFAADNWMHKSNGIQLGLTESLRCRLPENTDGTGYWTVTVYALGYEDYCVTVNVTNNDLHGGNSPITDEQKTELTSLKEQAESLLAGYDEATAGDTLKALKEHYDEAVTLLADEAATQAAASELIEELPALIEAVKAENSGSQQLLSLTETNVEDTDSFSEEKDAVNAEADRRGAETEDILDDVGSVPVQTENFSSEDSADNSEETETSDAVLSMSEEYNCFN